MSDIEFFSTNGHPERVDFRQALLVGQAPDKGLYMPEHIPVIPLSKISRFSEMSYPEIAYQVVKPYLGDLVADEDFRAMLQDAYNFDVPSRRSTIASTSCALTEGLPAPSRTSLPDSWEG